jgi:hypothetical protein
MKMLQNKSIAMIKEEMSDIKRVLSVNKVRVKLIFMAKMLSLRTCSSKKLDQY